MPEPIEIVVYTNNEPALIAEAKQKTPHWVNDDSGEDQLAGVRTPIIRKGNEIMANILVKDVELLGSFTNMTVLGHYDENDDFVEAYAGGKAKHDELYNPQPYDVSTPAAPVNSPFKLPDITVTVTPPKRFGRIAR